VVETANPQSPIPASTRPSPTDANAVAPALSPNGKFVFARRAVPNGNVDLRDSSTRELLDSKRTDEMEGRIDYPEWSPTRSEIVASRAEGGLQPGEPSAANDGRIVIIPITPGAAPAIGKPIVVATANSNRTYGNPTFSPDGNWIVFVSRPANQSSYRSVATRLHMIKRDGPGTIYDLGQANGPTDSAAGYPKFAPTSFNNCKTFFLTFQSRKDYGVVQVTSQSADPEWPQLWMTSIDLTKIVPGEASDPSSPPLWLPFQDPASKNLLGVWTAKVACDGTPQSCGGGAVCAAGHCVVAN
jgi:Tol biopolymer transport system component